MRWLASPFARFDYKYLVAATFVFGLFMDILDTTIVNVALPTLAEEFHADTATLEWVVTGYVLSLAVWIPASGWIGDRFGTKKTFLFATAMFTLGSALCGRAGASSRWSFFRILQGVGGGMLTPVGTAMLYRAFTPGRARARVGDPVDSDRCSRPCSGRCSAASWWTTVSWRWIFYVNVPVGAMSFAFSWLVLSEHKEPGAGKFDPLGFVLSGCGRRACCSRCRRAPNLAGHRPWCWSRAWAARCAWSCWCWSRRACSRRCSTGGCIVEAIPDLEPGRLHVLRHAVRDVVHLAAVLAAGARAERRSSQA